MKQLIIQTMPYKDPKEQKEYMHWYKINPKNRARVIEMNRNYQKRCREKLFEILGGKVCKKCGYKKDYRALQIDHKKGGGRKERKRFGNNHNLTIYYKNHSKEAKKKLQVLCANCNIIKMVKEQAKIRPHNLKYKGVWKP